jgi:hypothetical protein
MALERAVSKVVLPAPMLASIDNHMASIPLFCVKQGKMGRANKCVVTSCLESSQGRVAD